MTLLDKIKKDSLTARKARDTVASNLLGTLIGEATMVGKNNGNRDSTDEEVAKVVKKFLDNAKETAKHLAETFSGNKGEDILARTNREITILDAYMPAQMDEAKLRQVIKTYIEENANTNIGHIMKYLQMNYAGTYDGKLASQVSKELLA